MENALATVEREAMPLTARDIRANVNLIQEVMKSVMQKGTHYGTIPGCGDKSALFKPGAEKILSTFRIAVTPEVEDLSTPDCAHYRVKAIGTTASGVHVGTGIGECSSDEEKYKWRKAVCSEEFKETDASRKRVVWKRGQQGAYKLEQVRMNCADIANTVLKMAKKRALIDMCLTATAASDVFTQDIEDLPPEYINQKPAAPTVQQPRRASQPKPAAPAPQDAPPEEPGANDGPEELGEDLTPPEETLDDVYTGLLQHVTTKKGKKKNGQDYIRYGMQLEDGSYIGTFDTKIGDFAVKACHDRARVVIEWEPDGEYRNAKSIKLAE